jgi:aminoglycoside phosphotransferase (APT) family kinase protein
LIAGKPKVHALHFAGYGLDNHIVMEYMPGEPLDKVWRKLTTEQKEATCGQLGGYITQLQQLKGKRVEAANGEAIKICLSSTRNGGPFSTVREFNDWLVDGVFQRVTPKIWQDHCRASLSDNHEIVFAHGDFSPRNMLADPTGQITAVLDWEMAGWFPAYWDIGKILWDIPPAMPDYRFYLQHIVPFRYTQECLAMYQLFDWYPVA